MEIYPNAMESLLSAIFLAKSGKSTQFNAAALKSKFCAKSHDRRRNPGEMISRGKIFNFLHMNLVKCRVCVLGHPVLRRDPLWACRLFFFFFLLLLLLLGFLPPPNMAFSEAKHNEGNLVLIWYFRQSFL